MLTVPNVGYKVYRVQLYNQKVRALTAQSSKDDFTKHAPADAPRGGELLDHLIINTKSRVLRNQLARHKLQESPLFSETWAKLQTRDVVARDEAEAWALISERFPPEDGFVVESIVASENAF